MKAKDLPREFVKKCKAVTAKRPRTVIDHILKHGQITTEELKEKYGYNHPPRAARDVKEQGIPLEMFRVTGSDGRKIGAYRFGDPKKVAVSELVDAFKAQDEKITLPEEEVEKMAEKVLLDNPGPVSDYAKGQENARQFLFGKLMKEAAGKIDPKVGQQILKELLDART